MTDQYRLLVFGISSLLVRFPPSFRQSLLLGTCALTFIWFSCWGETCYAIKGYHILHGLPKCTSGKEPACQCRCKRHGFDPWVRKIPCRRAWQPTPLFLPGESHGWRSLIDCSPWCCKESDTTEVTLHTRMHILYSGWNVCGACGVLWKRSPELVTLLYGEKKNGV